MNGFRKLCAIAVALAFSTAARAESEVSFPSLDAPGGHAVMLKAHWYPVAAPKGPAIVLLHGCGGMYGRNGRPSERTRDYTQWLNTEGWHVLVVDSLTPRGERELCTQRSGSRAITMANRRLDALASLQWLAHRPEVDAKRLGLLGWSNGGSTVLASTNKKHRAVSTASVLPSFAVTFYPGCEAELKRGYEPAAPLLILVGEADDWTPAEPCHRLAASQPASRSRATPARTTVSTPTRRFATGVTCPTGCAPAKACMWAGTRRPLLHRVRGCRSS